MCFGMVNRSPHRKLKIGQQKPIKIGG